MVKFCTGVLLVNGFYETVSAITQCSQFANLQNNSRIFSWTASTKVDQASPLPVSTALALLVFQLNAHLTFSGTQHKPFIFSYSNLSLFHFCVFKTAFESFGHERGSCHESQFCCQNDFSAFYLKTNGRVGNIRLLLVTIVGQTGARWIVSLVFN